MGHFNKTEQKRNVLLLFTKTQNVGLWLIVHVTLNFFFLWKSLMSKFRLDGLNSGELCYLFIYGKKTENNEYEIECASNSVEL